MVKRAASWMELASHVDGRFVILSFKMNITVRIKLHNASNNVERHTYSDIVPFISSSDLAEAGEPVSGVKSVVDAVSL